MYDALTGFRVERIAGADRFGTNLEILKVAGIQPGEEILVCTGKEYADSLSASATGKPILLVYKRLTDEQKSFLSRLSGNSFCVLGGTSAVSEELAAAISTYGPISRLAGKDRLDTSVLVAEKYFRDADTAVIAYGWGFPDGLCGGPLAYANKAPLVLTHSKDSLYTFTAGYTVPAKIREGYILGGDKLISDKATRTLFCMSDYAVLSKIS
jgi:putative cell wall-binding protein